MSSRVVPFFPRFWELGFCGVVLEPQDEVAVEEDKFSEEVLVVAVGEVFCDSVEGDDESDGLENKPYISKRLRTFHIV
jgi:hypothetical protein